MVSFKNVAIVGVGLIGGSLAIAARKNGVFQTIVGIDTDPETIKKAESLPVIDWGTTDLQQGVKEADLVIVATPVRSIAPLVKNLIPFTRPGTIITDVGSVKGEIIAAVEEMPLHEIDFVGGHPIAGTENSGVEAAFPDLFLQKNCILTPSQQTSIDALEKVKQVWESVGAHVLSMDPKTHDYIFGAVSHLPHYVAFALVSCIGTLSGTDDNLFPFSAGGLKDFTRVAGSDPAMWTDIALMNRTNIVAFIDCYQESLNHLRRMIDSSDAEGLRAELAKIRDHRRNRIAHSDAPMNKTHNGTGPKTTG